MEEVPPLYNLSLLGLSSQKDGTVRLRALLRGAAVGFAEAGLAFARNDFKGSKEHQAMTDAYADLREVWRRHIRDPSQPPNPKLEEVEGMLHTSAYIAMRWAQHYVSGRGNVMEAAESMIRSMKSPASAAKEGMYFFSALMRHVKDPDDELREKKINKLFARTGMATSNKKLFFLRNVLEDPEKVLQLPEAQVDEAQ